MPIQLFSSVQIADIQKKKTAQFIVMMCIINVNAVGGYYRADIQDEDKQHFQVLCVACPFCGTVMSGKVHKTAEAISYIGEIENGKEPYFGLELWFLTFFRNKPVWALNREHLTYLIEYLSADLREKPFSIPKKTQADHLPTFMKTAKNRERIVKLLKDMQKKQ